MTRTLLILALVTAAHGEPSDPTSWPPSPVPSASSPSTSTTSSAGAPPPPSPAAAVLEALYSRQVALEQTQVRALDLEDRWVGIVQLLQARGLGGRVRAGGRDLP